MRMSRRSRMGSRRDVWTVERQLAPSAAGRSAPGRPPAGPTLERRAQVDAGSVGEDADDGIGAASESSVQPSPWSVHGRRPGRRLGRATGRRRRPRDLDGHAERHGVRLAHGEAEPHHQRDDEREQHGEPPAAGRLAVVGLGVGARQQRPQPLADGQPRRRPAGRGEPGGRARSGSVVALAQERDQFVLGRARDGAAAQALVVAVAGERAELAHRPVVVVVRWAGGRRRRGGVGVRPRLVGRRAGRVRQRGVGRLRAVRHRVARRGAYEHAPDVGRGARDHVRGGHAAHARRRGRARVDGRLHGRRVAHDEVRVTSAGTVRCWRTRRTSDALSMASAASMAATSP